MQKGQCLHFHCRRCSGEIHFSIFELDKKKGLVTCPHCDEKYSFHDETLRRQLEKFEKLCKQIVDSEEILSETSVGIDIEGRTVSDPYKILLTRLSSTLNLLIGEEHMAIDFRFEPLADLPRFTPREEEPKTRSVKIPLNFSVAE